MRLYLLLICLLFFGCVEKESQRVVTYSKSTAPYDYELDLPIFWPNNGSSLTNGPRQLGISEDFSTEEYNLFEDMKLSWDDAVPEIDFFNYPGARLSNKEYSKLSDYYDGENGIYKSYNWFSDLNEDALAITQFFAIRKNSGGFEYLELLHADIIINYKNFEYSIDENDFGKFDLPSIVVHEVGHYLGLKHEYIYTSVMQPTISTVEVARDLGSTDVNALYDNYNLVKAESNNYAVRVNQAQEEEVIVRGIIEHRVDGKSLTIYPESTSR